jgi:hypothetical protein
VVVSTAAITRAVLVASASVVSINGSRTRVKAPSNPSFHRTA